MKGQLNIEFLAAAGLFILALLALITSNQALPEYSSSMNRMDLNLEAKSVTDEILAEEGYHSYGDGGQNWEKNSSTIENTEGFGLIEKPHVVDREKLESIKTVTVDGTEALNYSQFRGTTDADNQFRFRFVWLPTVQTNRSYIKSSPPSDPNIEEPDTQSYSLADNRIHYGKISLRGSQYNFLVASHDGVYDSVYVNSDNSEGWNFYSPNPEEPYSLDDRLVENDFFVESIQNRENDRGAMVILEKEVKEFGPSPDPEKEVVTLSRFAVLEGEPLRMEVSTW